jgi:glycerol-3-phosphate dehydrogenase (NAD(P)+)
MNIAVVGAGNYGTVLAKVLAEQGSHDVCIWNWEGDAAPLDAIEREHENTAYLPGVTLPKSLRVERNLEAAVRGADLVVLTLPSHVCLSVAKQMMPYLSRTQTVLVAAKGFCKETKLPLILALRDMLRETQKRTLTIMSGPAVAKELAAGAQTCMQVSGYKIEHIERVQAAFAGTPVTLCRTDDVVGISIGGSFKNVYAIALGICDGLKMSLNTKAAILVFAMEELSNISDVLGGKRETVYGLSGLGDLIGTGMSDHSRNRRFGEYIGKGFSVDASREYVGQVVEGVDAIEVLHSVAAEHNVTFLFVDQIRDILASPNDAKEKILSFINSCSIHRV